MAKWSTGKKIGCGCAILFLVAILGIGTLTVGVFSLLKSSDAYQDSLTIVQNSPELQERLGTPIEPGFFMTGSINVSNDTGTADITYPVSGPNESGKVRVVAEKDREGWHFSRITYYPEEGPGSLDLIQ